MGDLADKAYKDHLEKKSAASSASASPDSMESLRNVKLVVGFYKDKPEEMHLSMHASDAQTDKYDQYSLIPLNVGGDSFCLKLDDMPKNKENKRAKITPSALSPPSIDKSFAEVVAMKVDLHAFAEKVATAFKAVVESDDVSIKFKCSLLDSVISEMTMILLNKTGEIYYKVYDFLCGE
jgi:hypothetical protein